MQQSPCAVLLACTRIHERQSDNLAESLVLHSTPARLIVIIIKKVIVQHSRPLPQVVQTSSYGRARVGAGDPQLGALCLQKHGSCIKRINGQ